MKMLVLFFTSMSYVFAGNSPVYDCTFSDKFSKENIKQTFWINGNFEERIFNIETRENLPRHKALYLKLSKTYPRCNCGYQFKYILNVLVGVDLVASYSIDESKNQQVHLSVNGTDDTPEESIYSEGQKDTVPSILEGESKHYRVSCTLNMD